MRAGRCTAPLGCPNAQFKNKYTFAADSDHTIPDGIMYYLSAFTNTKVLAVYTKIFLAT